tara:strand:+ start:282 stop:635 length:354 start_codon:yes stop_codon:yes gene_type:complete
MKLTKKLLEQYVREAWQQKIFGGEEEVKVQVDKEPAPQEPWQQIEKLVRRTNFKFDKIYGFPMIRKFYKLHRNYAAGIPIPEITQIIPMQDKTIDIVFADGLQEKYIPYDINISRGY